MEIIRGIPSEENPSPYLILAVGNFDGVHLGHQAILNRVVERSREAKGTAVALTFDPHPVRVLSPDRPLHLLTSFEQKARLIDRLGLDRLVCIPFTREFSEQKPMEFVENVLHRAIRAREIYVGRNFAFGRDREGSAEDLKALGENWGIKVFVVEQVRMDGLAVSSSLIRKFLLQGEVAQANRLLGRAYEVEGQVVPGERRGRELGYPTANLRPPSELLPRPGVYAVQVFEEAGRGGGEPLAAVGYVGSRPTFGRGEPLIEVHLLDYRGQLYRERLRVAFLERIRDERVFSGGEDLARQIEKDVKRALDIHGEASKGKGPAVNPPC